MLDVGMTELLCFAIIAILVLGQRSFRKLHALQVAGMFD